jgi:tRNA threonylcarbamoyladenosine modification (KEOPS) complex Cgi121 subunit
MKLRTIDVVILLVFGLLCIARATWGILKDINIDLSEAKSVIGRVASAEIKQIKAATFKSSKYKTVFALKLENSDQNFAIDRGTEICSYLKGQIKSGDTVKLFYRLSTGEYNTFIFQIEKGQNIIADLSDYKKKETKMITLGYLFGFVILGGLSIWYIKKRKQSRLMQS